MNDQTTGPAEARLVFRVRYVECDPMGYMHHSHYFPMFEMGRTELLRQTGMSYRELEACDVLFTVAKICVSFKKPARYDDELELVTRIARQTHVRIDHAYEMYRKGTGELLCTAESTVACINRKGELQAIPEFLSGKR
jgi:acyl-CoA thioester hydrolase